MTYSGSDRWRNNPVTDADRTERESSKQEQTLEMTENPDTGGEPVTLGRCTECWQVYPAQLSGDGLRPIGTDGTCNCGNDEFEPSP